MNLPALGWLPSAGVPITPRQLLRVLRTRDPEGRLFDGVAAHLGVQRVSLRASGRDALRCVLASASRHTGRDEIVLPAYTCFSVAAAAVASGLRVRLVDVTEDGRIDRKCLETLPLERTAAIVVCNLFGLAEPIANTLTLAHAAGVLVVDDAAQAFGALGVDGPAGGRGDIGILSFGRGKPLSGLGGGAIAWNTWPAELPDPRPAEPARAMAALRAAAYDVALAPPVFHALSRIPALGIGETHFDVDFARGPIDPGAMALAAATLPSAGVAADARAAEALRLADRLAPCGLRPIMAIDGARGVYPRFFGLAPDAAARDAALAALRPIGAGATAMYPTALDQVPGLRPHLCGVEDYPGARDLAARLLTLPSNGGLRANRLRKAERLLQKTLMQQS